MEEYTTEKENGEVVSNQVKASPARKLERTRKALGEMTESQLNYHFGKVSHLLV